MAARNAGVAPASKAGDRDALDVLYDEFVSRTTNARRRNSLENLYKTLRHLLSVGSNVTSVAAVARSIADLGFNAPKAQSIRNVEGKDFRDLIDSYLALSDRNVSDTPSDDQKLVSGIDDLQVAAQVRWILNENRSLKRRLDLLHAAFQKLEPIKLLTTAAATDEFDGDAGHISFTEMEIDAVREFQANLSDIHCTLDAASGALLYNGNLEVAPPGFGQALAKVTGKNS